jgi:four helix bundle protein
MKMTTSVYQPEVDQEQPPFDICERTFLFAVRSVKLVKRFPQTSDASIIGRQFLRSATSVGANVEEAHGAESQRDFVHKMGIACKEARETRYWLRLIEATVFDDKDVRALSQESDELVRILSTIVIKSRKKI